MNITDKYSNMIVSRLQNIRREALRAIKSAKEEDGWAYTEMGMEMTIAEIQKDLERITDYMARNREKIAWLANRQKLTPEEQTEYDGLKHVHQGYPGWRRWQELNAKLLA